MNRLVKLKHLLFSGLFFLSLISVYGQEITVKSALERDSIWLGDQIKMILMVEQPAGAKITFPQLGDSIQKIEILERSKIDTSKIEGNKLQLKQTYLITCFDSGAHYIPTYYFKVKKALESDSVRTNSLILVVKLPNVDLKKGPTDIKKPFGAPITFKEVAPWILGIILIGAIIFLVIYMISRRNKNKPLFQRPPKPKLPPHVIALEELDKLKNEELWQHDKIKDYYTRLTDIIRIYIEERFSIPTMEKTTVEILSVVKTEKLLEDPKAFRELSEILEVADLVKFAKLTPMSDDNIKALTSAYLFVEETSEKVETVSDQPAESDKPNELKESIVDLNDKKEDNQL